MTEADKLRFAVAARETVLPSGSDSPEKNGIGTLGEKRLHAAIKKYLCEDVSCHEVSVTADGTHSRYVADVLEGNELYEVQTGGFYPLRPKLEFYLSHTSYHITVVHPIPAYKTLSWIHPQSGEITPPRKSPKRGRIQDVAREVYWIAPYLGTGRVSLRILLIGMQEYRRQDGWGREGKRGSTRYERIPVELTEDVILTSPEDFGAVFLPSPRELPDGFTAAAYGKAAKIRGMGAYSVLKLLTSLGVLQEGEKQGRAKTWERAKK